MRKVIISLSIVIVSAAVILGCAIVSPDIFVIGLWLFVALILTIISVRDIYDYRTENKRPITEFVVRDYFTTDNTVVKFSLIRENFKSWFYGKNEQVKGVAIPPHPSLQLARATSDSEILKGLIANKIKIETTMSGIYELLKLQPNGNTQGSLRTCGGVNVFYVRTLHGILCTVGVVWNGTGWCVNADLTVSSFMWGTGSRVFTY